MDWYNSFVILYDGVLLVWMIEYRYPALSIVCRLSSYLQRMLTTRSFTVAVHLLVLVSIVDLLLLLIVIYDCVGTYDETLIMDWYVGLCQSIC